MREKLAGQGDMPAHNVVSMMGHRALRSLSEHEPDLLESRLADFMDAGRPMEPQAQLSFMHEWWQVLGHEMPALTSHQAAQINRTLHDNPRHRAIFSPLLSDVQQTSAYQ